MSADSSATAAAAWASVPLSTVAAEDLFVLGRRAAAARQALHGDRATFIRSKRLLPGGAWRGPRDAALSYVEEADLAALGGWSVARDAGVKLLVGGLSPEAHRAAHADGARSLWRLPYRAGEEEAARLQRIAAVQALGAGDFPLWGVLPTPENEPHGLDTLRLMALCRLGLPSVAHVLTDVAALGPRLAQMSFGFGADELFGPIVSERALRLGDNANNPAMTRKEVGILLRGAGLIPCERFGDDTWEEVTP
ncbi:MAG TPA: hypothetical protein VGL59_24240 [Polyangia bacterium]|jgi:hypothetical protein